MLPSKLSLVYSHYRAIRTIELLHCIYEAENDNVCQLVGSHLDGNIFLYGYELDLMDCTAVGYLLEQYRGEVNQINCRDCDIDDDGFRILVNSLLSRTGNYSSHLQLDFNNHSLTRDKSSSLVASLLSSNLPIIILNIGERYNFGIDTTLCNSLHHNTTLKELYLDNLGLHAEHMQFLGQALSNNSTLSVLDISGNIIGPDGCQHLADVRNTSLSVLIMNDNDIGVYGVDYICELLHHNKSIRSIDLGSNLIKDDGVNKLVKCLKSNTILQQLYLRDNDITSIGAGYLTKLLTDTPCSVNDIRLNDNPLEDKGVDLILQSMPSAMEWVMLDNIKMTSCNSSLCSALHKIKGISFTPPENCSDISDSLADTTVLERLWLYKGSDAAYNTMISGISRNNSIKSLCFDGGYLHHQSIINLAEVIKVSKTISMFVLIEAVSAASDYMLIMEAMAVNTSIKYIIIIDGVEGQLDKSHVLQFIKQLKHNYMLELLVLGEIDDSEDDDQFNSDVENLMLVEQINDTRQSHGVNTLLYVNMNVDYNYYQWLQVKMYILYYTLHVTIKCFCF